jgi:predicted nucleotidyltransferase
LNSMELIAILRNIKPVLEHKYGVTSMGLFGSYVRREERADSDVDILVELKKPIGLLRFVELKSSLSELLGAEVDLVTTAALKPAIRQHVLKEVVYV